MSNDLPTETLFLGKLENKLFAGDGTKLDGKFTALKMKILLVANKADLEGQREVSIEKGREMAKSWQLADNAFQEVSATRPVEIKVAYTLGPYTGYTVLSSTAQAFGFINTFRICSSRSFACWKRPMVNKKAKRFVLYHD